MSKETKRTILYRGGNLPERLGEILNSADETDLKVLVALLMAADENGDVAQEVSLGDLLGLESPEVEASLKFWRGAGLIGKAAESKKKKAPAMSQTAHRGGAVEHSGVAPYQTEELADLLEKKQTLIAFVTECQRVLGKTVNMHDTGLLVGLVDQFGFEEEAVLAILAYAVRIGKATVRYAEKIAIGFYDEGRTSADAVYERIRVMEQSAETISQIRSLFGMGNRDLSTTEKKLFTAWTQKMGYGIDEIRLAYDITIDAIHTPAPKYTNSILEAWYAEGLHTARDIEEFTKAQKAEKGKSDVEKSYDVDEFFEASMQRSFAEFEKLTGTSDKK